VAIWIAFAGGFRQVVDVRWGVQIARGLIGLGMLTSFVYALGKLPLAEAYAIFFVAPLLITALSVPMLGEHVDAARWLAILVGFAGVLVVLRPTGHGALTLAGLAVLGASLGYAFSAILVRLIARTDSTLSMIFWFLVPVTVVASVVAAPRWVPIARHDWWLLAVLGIIGAAGQYLITEAFRHGEASVLAPFEYTALAWGLGLDWLFWRATPQLRTLVGGGIVVLAGLYILHRERRSSRADRRSSLVADCVPP
jgi:drug/metabolite transporter (DMT)-like permease